MNCNTCIHINITEIEQFLRLDSKDFKYHFCEKYKRRVFHRDSHCGYNEMIYPCPECTKEKGRNYKCRIQK